MLAARVGRRDHRPLLGGKDPLAAARGARRGAQPDLRRGASHRPQRRARRTSGRSTGSSRRWRRDDPDRLARLSDRDRRSRGCLPAGCSWSPTRMSRAAGWPDRLGADFAGRFVLAARRGAARALARSSGCSTRCSRPGSAATTMSSRSAAAWSATSAGFAAAVLKRGCGWIAVPTSLARPGRLGGRRQDRDQRAPGQESDRRLPCRRRWC